MSAAAALAPGGTLRAAINFGNPVLAQRAPDGTPGGVTIALATELARQLGVPLALVPFEGAGAVTDALPSGVFDICFLAIDPVRGQGLDYTEPYVLIEGGYVVRGPSRFQAVEDVDTPGTTVGVATGSAYDLYLTRSLTQATLVRSRLGGESVSAFLGGANDVLAGVKQPLMEVVASNPGLRMLPGRFMSIEQAMATPKGRDGLALETLRAFILAQKRSGFVARALTESGQVGAAVAD